MNDWKGTVSVDIYCIVINFFFFLLFENVFFFIKRILILRKFRVRMPLWSQIQFILQKSIAFIILLLLFSL